MSRQVTKKSLRKDAKCFQKINSPAYQMKIDENISMNNLYV